jgi:hypothetical protein
MDSKSDIQSVPSPEFEIFLPVLQLALNISYLFWFNCILMNLKKVSASLMAFYKPSAVLEINIPLSAYA